MAKQPESETPLEFGPFGFEKDLGKLSKHGTPIRLRGMPLKILQHLVERPGEVVSRAELQSLLWNGTSFGDFEKGLNTAVNVVRKTLGDSADQPRYIETIPGQGYRFIAPIRSTVTENAPQIDEVSDQSPAGPSKSKRWWIAAALAFALVAGVWWAFRSKPPVLIDGSTPSTNREANDQYNLAFHFMAFQNDFGQARRTFERALELDPQFASARLQRALMIVIEILNGFNNDESLLYEAEAEVHKAEQSILSRAGLTVFLGKRWKSMFGRTGILCGW